MDNRQASRLSGLGRRVACPTTPAANTEPAEGPRFIWSRYSRHLFLLTRESGMEGVVRLENGEEVYLMFDTGRWEGAVGPSEKEIEAAGFPR